MNDFVRFKLPELKAFVYARSYCEINKKVDKEFQMPTKKGKIEQAEAADSNLLILAFKLNNSKNSSTSRRIN